MSTIDSIRNHHHQRRVICFTDSLGAGGAQRQMVGLAALLADKGFSVKVCYYHDIPFYASFLDDKHISHELIPRADDYWRRITAVIQYLNKENPSWVIAYQETPSLIASIAKAWLHSFHLITSERSTTQKMSYRDRLRFFLYRWSDAIVPNSFAQGSFIAKHYPSLSSKLHVIPNFVDLKEFEFVRKKRNTVPIILCVASITPYKNTIGLIHGLSVLQKKGILFHLKWFGKTDVFLNYYKECVDLIRNLGLGESVELLPKTNTIVHQYQLCDYFCLPSYYEGTPNVICEAMATGRPIICSNVGDNHIYVKEGENGFLFNPNNQFEIVEKLEKALIMNDVVYEGFCIKSRALAEQLLDKNRFCDHYSQIINCLH